MCQPLTSGISPGIRAASCISKGDCCVNLLVSVACQICTDLFSEYCGGLLDLERLLCWRELLNSCRGTGFVQLSMFGMPSNYYAILGFSLCSRLKLEEANLPEETLEKFSTLLPMPVPQKLLWNRQRKRPTEISASVLLPTARCCKQKPSTLVTFSALFPPDVLLFST